jgi:hypothetical protein
MAVPGNKGQPLVLALARVGSRYADNQNNFLPIRFKASLYDICVFFRSARSHKFELFDTCKMYVTSSPHHICPKTLTVGPISVLDTGSLCFNRFANLLCVPKVY